MRSLRLHQFGASSVNLTFPFFDVEEGAADICNYDYVEIYDGADEFAPLIGRYCNTNPPPAGTITSTGSAITILFNSDGGLEEEGFQIEWTCNLPGDVPEAAFIVNSEISCSGMVYFTDLSTNAPIEWLWEFGDGETSTDQNPTHLYDEGTYSVTLTATNIVGEDVETITSLITVEYPELPTATGDANCPTEMATLSASGDGTLKWYETAEGGTPIGEGSTFTTGALSTTTTFYVEDDLFDDPQYVGPADNTFGGGSTFSGDQHLVFNTLNTVILKSVVVYAEGDGFRTIELRSADGEIIESKSIFIEDGEQRIYLDLLIPTGEGYQLGTAFESAPSLFRNNAGLPDYPFVLDESVEIVTSSAGDEYYYFFYDWEINAYACASERVPVVAEVFPASDVSITEIERVCLQNSEFAMTASSGGGIWSADCATCIDPTTGIFNPSDAGEGSWTVTYTIDGTCSYLNTVTVDVVDCLGLDDDEKEAISIYPNPTNGLINISTGTLVKGRLIITDIVGKTVVEIPFNSNTISIDLDDYNARGTYFVHFANIEGTILTTKKVVKN